MTVQHWPDEPPYDDVPDDVASWAPIDLSAFLDGTHRPAVPTLLPRTDGAALIYPGLTHSFHGESESGKSLLLQIEAVRLITSGDRVLFIDFESDAAAVADRLIMLGATPQQIAANFVYVRPEASPFQSSAEASAWQAMMSQRFSLAVIDGVTDSLSLFGYGTNSNDEVTAWSRLLPKQIAARTGAAVAVIDHVTKDSDTRGRFAIGGQAKMSGLTGAGYTVEVAEPLGRGLRGVIVVRVGKDRPGHVRGQAGPMRRNDRTQEVARVTIDSTNGHPVVSVDPPQPTDPNTSGGFRPTELMERVSRLLEDNPGPFSRREVEAAIVGKKEYVSRALELLVHDGHVARTDGPRNSKLHTLARPYRQTTETTGDGQRPQTALTVPVPLDRGTGDGRLTVPGDSRGTVGDAAPERDRSDRSDTPEQAVVWVDGFAIPQPQGDTA